MKQFTIMIGYEGTPGPCPSSIPWEAIAPYEGQAKQNHQQTLERLAERGGLSPAEAFMVMHGRRWDLSEDIPALQKEACVFLDTLVRESQIVKLAKERDDALLQNDELVKRIYRIGLLCDKVQGLEHGFCPDTGEPRDNLTRIKIVLERFIEKPRCEHQWTPVSISSIRHLHRCSKCGEKTIIPREQEKQNDAKMPICDKEYTPTKDTYGYCGLEFGHDGPCGRG